MRILNIYRSTISDGPGLRYSIYLAGCRHRCPGCHNPESWDPLAGTCITPDMLQRIADEINGDPLLDGITLSGGDPFYDPESLYELLLFLSRHTNLPIWVYTGYRIEELLADAEMSKCLTLIDTVVDGRFVQELFDPRLSWRGSSNQRIVKVKDYLSPPTCP